MIESNGLLDSHSNSINNYEDDDGSYDPPEHTDTTKKRKEEGFGQKFQKFWMRKVPRPVRRLVYDGENLTKVQQHTLSIFIGMICGLVVTLYKVMLNKMLEFFWIFLPKVLDDVGFFDHLPKFTWNFFVAVTLSFLTGVLLVVFKKIKRFEKPGSIATAIDTLHDYGTINPKYIVPMFVVSLISITSGASAGPEASMIIILGGLGSFIAKRLTKDIPRRRILTLSAMSGGLGGFFGLPLGSTFFCLEIPHRTGIQYFEALSPSIVSSLASTLVQKCIMSEDFGPRLVFPVVEELPVSMFGWAMLMGVVGAFVAVIFIYWMKLIRRAKMKLKLNPIINATLCGAVFGTIGVLMPSTMFWSENELQYIIDYGKTPLPYAKYPGVFGPFFDGASYYAALILASISLAKLFAISITLAGDFPGGIIFPLFFAGATLSQSISTGFQLQGTGLDVIFLICLMGSIEASITRTPFGTGIILLQLSLVKVGHDGDLAYISILPIIISALTVAILITKSIPFYSEQRNRRDLIYVYDPEHLHFGHDENSENSKVHSQS
eukprot:TRINITY_DN4731_c0_g1_i1.p1 TRINITY_DN4731_c0_g1~~TRINITY_DN4731_c0_g1_i1.p1  ORF type:complete len:549 (+),score=54.98 TRINITY_DN4731_c0_g1_i1:49-1695(+)